MFFKRPFIRLSGSAVLILITVNVAVYGQRNTAPSISVEGDGLKSFQIAQADLMNMKQAEVVAKDHDGRERKYSGVPLVDILSTARVPLGSQLRGKNLLKYVVVKAADNYEVVFSLPEIDPEFTLQTILLAYKVDGEDLAEEDGPYRIIVPNDKKHARWVREVTSIRIAVINK